MTDSKATVRALINARRPFREIKGIELVDDDGEAIKLYARRPGHGEQSEIDNIFNKAYKEERDRLTHDESELAVFKRSLKRQSTDDLVSYIVDCDEADYEYQAKKMLDEPEEDEVKKLTEELKERAKADMKANTPRPQIEQEALERHIHIQSFRHGQESILRHVVVFTVYGPDKQRLFADVADLDEMPDADIADLSVKTADALRDPEDTKKDIPLKQAASKPSDEASSSPSTSTEDTKPSSGP